MTRQNAIQTQQQASSTSPLSRGGILQRKCESCGQHTIAGGECADCGKKKIGLQRKLTIGASNDPLEQEADRVADRVMSMSSNSTVGNAPLQIQRYTGGMTEGNDTAPASVDRVLASSGKPLDPALERDMGQRFDHDFSHVRVHTGADAERSAREVSANAYTVGNSIVFGVGQFAPETNVGRRLVAHELTHVLQQSDGVLGLRSTPQAQVLQRNAIGDAFNRIKSAIDPRTRQFISDMVASVRESPQHVGEFITGDLWESIKEHWFKILAVTLGLLGAEAVIGALGAAPTGVTQIIATILEIAVVAILGYFAAIEVVGVAEEGARWWTAAHEANGDASKISEASRAFVRTVWHILMAIMAVAGVRARIRGGAVGRITAPFGKPPPPPALRVIQGGNPAPLKIEGGRVGSTSRSAPRGRSSQPVATAGDSAARAFQPEPIPDVPQPVRPVPEPGQNVPIAGNTSAPIRPPGIQPLPAAAAGIGVGTAPQLRQRRNANQTCEDDILDELQAEKDRICNSIPQPSCSAALAKLQKGSKLKGTSVAGINRTHIENRIKRINECLAQRNLIQDECFGGVPDEAHTIALNELNNGLTSCKELIKLVDSLSSEDQEKLLPSDW